ncbi:hypothetical protein PG994_006709 [Apiospora phragmitis]|uniref:Uncharacterized protein n=1 Tax=Apiospora phragmitis TaxID=2905665 RepID=A0ABR1VFU0_9PEZI
MPYTYVILPEISCFKGHEGTEPGDPPAALFEIDEPRSAGSSSQISSVDPGTRKDRHPFSIQSSFISDALEVAPDVRRRVRSGAWRHGG